MAIMITLYFIIAALLATTDCVPVRDPYLQELCSIASQPCVSAGRESYEASPAMKNAVANLSDPNEDNLLVQIMVEIEEAMINARHVYNNIQGWVSYMNSQDVADIDSFLKSMLKIPRANHSGLREEENSRLQAMLQLINYALFIKKLDNDSALGNSRAALQELRFKILQASCTLRGLLPQVSAANLTNYAEQDLSGHFFSMASQNGPMKRAVCCLVVNIVQNTLAHTEVHIDTRSVVISGDV